MLMSSTRTLVALPMVRGIGRSKDVEDPPAVPAFWFAAYASHHTCPLPSIVDAVLGLPWRWMLLPLRKKNVDAFWSGNGLRQPTNTVIVQSRTHR
jgi:hypothetical protein